MKFAKYIFFFFLGLTVSIVVSEVGLQFLPVSKGFFGTRPTKEMPVSRFIPDKYYTYSLGWNFRDIVHGKFNNLGYISDHDYVAKVKNIAVIGNSYIESRMICNGKSISDDLDKMMSPKVHVYAFGQPGANLAGYLLAVNYAINTFHPNSLIILITNKDIEKSLNYQPWGFWFSEKEGGFKIESGNTSDLPNPNYYLRKFLHSSSIFSYFHNNLRFSKELLVGAGKMVTRSVAQQEIGEVVFNEQSQRVGEFFIKSLVEIHHKTGSEIILVFDGDRKSIYEEKAPNRSEVDFLMNLAKNNNIKTIDLQKYFELDYSVFRKPFDYERFDGHWNERGHAVAAAAIFDIVKGL